MGLLRALRVSLPAYLVLSGLLLLAMVSLWLPWWVENVPLAEAAPLTNFNGYTVVAPTVPQTSQSKLLYHAGEYAAVFSSSTEAGVSTTCSGLGTEGSCGLYFTKSSDAGVTWSTPVLISSDLYFNISTENIGQFAYDPQRNAYVVLYKQHSDFNLVQSFSTSSGATWSTYLVESNSGFQNNLTDDAKIAFSTSTNLRAVLYQRDGYILAGITTNTSLNGDWPSSTIQYHGDYFDADSMEYNIRPLGISIDASNTVHVAYTLATTTVGGYEIRYARSSNSGVSWVTSTISGKMTSLTNFDCFECYANTAAVDPLTGRLIVAYYLVNSVNTSSLMTGELTATATMFVGQLDSNQLWVTTTVTTGIPIHYYFTDFAEVSWRPSGAVVPYSNMYAVVYSGANSNPYLAINTSSLSIEVINTSTVHERSEMSLAFKFLNNELAFMYVDRDSYQLRFATTSFPLNLNTAPTTTDFTVVQTTDGNGVVVGEVSVLDADHDLVTLYVDYSTNGGSTWASTTFEWAIGESAPLNTVPGRITGIATPDDGQTINFLWDTTDILFNTSTQNVMLRILAYDGKSHQGYRFASFSVDNVIPLAPNVEVGYVTTSTVRLYWDNLAGTSAYLVSSTAGVPAVVTASQGVVTKLFTGLLPSTSYSFQVQSIDSVGNPSAWSAIVSTTTLSL